MLLTKLFSVLLVLGTVTANNEPGYPRAYKLSRRADHTMATKRDALGAVVMGNRHTDNEYVMEVSVGTPPQTVNMFMDSFSPYTTIHGGTEDVPGSGLKTDKSTSFHNTGEKLDTRWAGPFNYTRATDKIKLGPLDLDNARFIYMNVKSSSASTIGFGFPLPEDKGEVSLLHEAAKQWTDKLIGFYFSRHRADPGAVKEQQTYKDSEVMLGGVNPAKFTGDIAYNDIKNASADGWTVTLNSMNVNGKSVDLKSELASAVNTVADGQDGVKLLVSTRVHAIVVPTDVAPRIYANIPGAEPMPEPDLANGWMWQIPCNTTGADIRLTIGGIEYAMNPRDLIIGVVGDNSLGGAYGPSPTPATGMCMGAFTGGEPAMFGVGTSFLKNVYTVFRFDPPAVGFAKLADNAQAGNAQADTKGSWATSTSVSTFVAGGASIAALAGVML